MIVIGASSVITHVDTTKYSNHFLKTPPLGISIVLYRVAKADKIDELSNLEKQMDKAKSVNLYKITEDLGIIFMNTADPYSDEQALPYKMLFGSFVSKPVGDRVVNGFILTTEVAAICNWIKQNKIESFEGFSEVYDNLSSDAKQALIDIGSEDKEGLFNGYVKPYGVLFCSVNRQKFNHYLWGIDCRGNNRSGVMSGH